MPDPPAVCYGCIHAANPTPSCIPDYGPAEAAALAAVDDDLGTTVWCLIDSRPYPDDHTCQRYRGQDHA